MKNKTTSYKISQTDAQYGKLPPQAIEVEEAILGALILEADAYSKISSLLSFKSFYKDEHQKIFNRIKELSDAGIPIDMMTVGQGLKDNGELEEVGGPAEIARLTARMSSSGHIESWAKIIQQKFIQRELIRISLEIQMGAYDGSLDVSGLIESASSKITELFINPSTNIKTSSDLVLEMHDRIKQNYLAENGITGIATGIPKLDKHTGGLQVTDLTILAGEPGQGKTSLAVTITNNTTSLGNSVGFISIEMPGVQLIIKITSQETGVSSGDIFKTKLSDENIGLIESRMESVGNKLLYVDDRAKSLDSVLSSIRYIHHKYGVKLFFVDFIQLVTVDGLQPEPCLAKVVQSLKQIAKDLVISIVALSQQRREANTLHRPSIDRLRGSGQIGEAADNIILLWRPEEYGIGFFDDEEYIPTEGKAMLDFAKGRNIGTDKFIVSFAKEIGKFYEESFSFPTGVDPDGRIESGGTPF